MTQSAYPILWMTLCVLTIAIGTVLYCLWPRGKNYTTVAEAHHDQHTDTLIKQVQEAATADDIINAEKAIDDHYCKMLDKVDQPDLLRWCVGMDRLICLQRIKIKKQK